MGNIPSWVLGAYCYSTQAPGLWPRGETSLDCVAIGGYLTSLSSALPLWVAIATCLLPKVVGKTLIATVTDAGPTAPEIVP